MWHVWETREMHTVLVERHEGDKYEDLGIDGVIVLKCIFKK
jgi:hypothetical protein